MKRRILSIITALALCLSLCPSVALAADGGTAQNPWECGNGVTAVLDNGTLTISGTGTMKNWSFTDEAPWKNSGITNVTIEAGVTSIGEYAFYGCAALAEISIPNGVTSIGSNAFNGCNALAEILIPNGVTSIGSNAFNGCNALAEISIPESIKSIGVSAFQNCAALRQITIPGNIDVIDYGTFGSCTALESVTINGSVTGPIRRAFSGCTALKSLTINGSVGDIVGGAFFGSGINKIEIHGDVGDIEGGAFSNCTALKSLTITGNATGVNKSIGGSAFSGCSGLTSVTIPESVTSIGSGAFGGCSGLTSVTIPESVTSIEGSAFSGCSGLTSVTIPESVTSIEGSAFSGCSGLISVTYPAGLISSLNANIPENAAQYVYGDLTGTVTLASARAITVAEGKTLTIPSGATLALADSTAQLINNGTILNNGTIQIAAGGSLSGTGTLSGSGTFTTENLTDDMISVPTDLFYNGEDRSDALTTALTEALSNVKVPICEKDFTVSGWTLAVAKTDDLHYTATYKNDNDATNTFTKTITLQKSGTDLADGKVKTYKDETETTSFTAGDTIKVVAKPTPTEAAPTNSAMFAASFTTPGAGQMAVFVDDAQVSAPVDAVDGTYTMEVSADDVLAAAGGPGNVKLTARFVESASMAGAASEVDITISAVAKIEKDSVTAYVDKNDLINAFTNDNNAGATFTLLDDVELTNTLTIGINCTLDLAEYTIRYNQHNQPFAAAIALINSTVTIRGEGGVTNTNGAALRIDGTHATLEGGTFCGGGTYGTAVILAGNSLSIPSGAAVRLEGSNIGLNVGMGTVKLSAGTYSGGTAAINISAAGKTLADLLDTTGDTRYAYYKDGTALVTEGLSESKLPAGTHTVKPCTHLLNGTGACPVCGGAVTTAAQVTIGDTTTYYGDISSAWAAVQGQTADLYLLKSVNVDNSDYLKLSSGNVTLDMADGVVLSSNSAYVIRLMGGELTLNSGTIRNPAVGLMVTGGTLRVSGGTVEGNRAVNIDSGSGGRMEITGGTFTGTGSGSIGLIATATVKISGGQFSGSQYAVYNRDGTMSDLLAEDYAFKKNGNWVTNTSGDSLTGTVTVEPAPVKITAQPVNTSQRYGDMDALSIETSPGQNESVTYQWYVVKASGAEAVSGEIAPVFSPSQNQRLDVGSYQYFCEVTKDGYTQRSNTVTFTVTPRQVNPSITGTASKTYDGTTNVADGQLSITLEGVVTGDDVTATATSYAYGNANAGENKTITASGITLEGGSKDNYTLSITTATTTGTITQATVSITWDSNPQTVTYSGTQATITVPTVSAENGVTVNVTPEYSYAAQGGATFTPGLPTSAGTYTVRASIVESGNLTAAQADMTLTINKASLSIDSATAASKPYDGNTTATVEAVTFDGLKNGETLALDTDYTATGTFGSADAGEGKSVTVTVTLADTAKVNNYDLTPNTTTATADITKADPVVTAVSVSSPDPIYESVSLNNITLTHGADDTAGTVALDAGQTLTVGTKGYAWTFTPDDTNNYNTATGTISLTVAVDALQSIAVTTPPSKTAYTYGENFDKTGMVITATYASGATKVVTGEVQISPAELTVTTTELTITYQGKTTTQAITVGPKTVSAPTIELSPNSFVYDGTGKEPAVTVKDGEKVIPADEYTVGYSNNINAGTATVTITNVAGNYTVSGTTTFAITAKPLTGAQVEVTGTFTYTGNALTPAPTVTLDGKTLTENTDYTVAHTGNTNAGTATITVTGKGNYSGTAQGTFTIGRATLTADGTGTASGTYGDKLSELAVSGLTAKLGATEISGTWKLTGDTVPNVGDSGEYTATFTPTTGADNYNALEAQVTLNIAQATAPTPQTGTLNVQNGHAREYTYDLSRLLPVLASGQSFGGEVTYTLKTVNITEAGYCDSDTAVISGTTLTLPVKAVESTTESSIGTITVTISSKNFADVDATINVNRVNKQPVSIEGVAAQNGTYDGESHNGYTGTPTASPYSGGFTVTYAKADGTALSGAPTNAGDYTVTITLNENNDYTGSRTLSFTISKASITIKADDKRADVGAAKPALTYTVTGLVSGDTLATAPTLACDADMNTIGQYPITASGAAVPSGGNYNTAITYVPGTLSVTDPTIPVTGVTLNKTSALLTVGGSERLTATVTPSDATDKSVTWASSNTSVATVDASGNITAVSAGTATITVTTADGAKTATCSVTVRSNSGGGSSYVPSTPSNPSTSAITVPVSGDKSTVNVSASVSGTTATVSRIDTTQIENVIGDNGQASMVEIDFTGLDKTIDTVNLPVAAIKDIAAKAQNEEVGGLTVKLPEAEISFDANALSAIQAQAGSQITLTVTPAKPTDLNNRQKEAVGSAPVFDLTLRSSSGAITDFRGGYATVSLPYTLAAGQNPSGVVVYYLDSTGNITPCTTMYDVRSKSAIFTTGHLSLYFVGYDPTAVWVNPFSDVAEGAWYYDAVRYASENGLMGGYGNGMFGPNDNLSRAQFAQILFNKEGRPVVNYLLQYSDVADGAWYTEAIRWATSLGIVGGYGNGTFGPNDNITREQLAVMLWRYSGSPAATNKELHFNDTDEISGFALEALRWAVENGIINGYGNGRLGPQGRATRAQVAQILKNFLDNQK